MANLRTITNFKSALRGGGARPNLFEVDITGWPGGENMGDFGNDAKEEFQFLCKAAALPSSNITPIEIPFRGRTLKVAGDRTFDTWTITIINDENFRLRTKFEQWMNGINKLTDGSGATQPGSYMGNAVVHQLGRGANQGRNSTTNSGGGDGSGGRSDITPLRTYYFSDIFPTEVSEIGLSYDTTDTIEEFTVTFQVQYWVAGSNSTNGGPADQRNSVTR
tara:strand:- start:10359 stop:11018 length:660 start_codon:yes stop_codon:yes gene_type:complete